MRELQIIRSRALLIALAGFFSTMAACTVNEVAPTVASQSNTAPFRLESAKWSVPYEGPEGYQKGAQRAVLGVDPVSGGETYYARFPAGTKFELHWHSNAEYVVLLKGKGHSHSRDREKLARTWRLCRHSRKDKSRVGNRFEQRCVSAHFVGR
jgi:hypothetical protein